MPDRKDLEFWQGKIRKASHETFTTRAAGKETAAHGRHALQFLAWLQAQPRQEVQAESLRDLAVQSRIPLKFISRAVSMLTRYGLVTELGPGLRLKLQAEAFSRRKNKVKRARGPISKWERARLLTADRFRCGHCGNVFPADELAIDHIVPLSFRGADNPGNWVALCRQHNAVKSDGLDSWSLRYHRGKEVRGTIGVRFADGSFWPHINGRTHRETRTDWRAERDSATRGTLK